MVQADPEVGKNAVLGWEKEPEGRLEGVGAGLGAGRPHDPPAWMDDLPSWRPAVPRHLERITRALRAVTSWLIRSQFLIVGASREPPA